MSPFARLLRQRHSTRKFDDQRPITLEELSCFLEGTAPILSELTTKLHLGEDGPSISYAPRPYPSAGACYEFELYLAVDKCEGLARGFYHYEAGEHALVSIEVRSSQFEAVLMRAAFAMGAPAAPQILITIAARFARVSWKYSAIAYGLILKDVGVLMQAERQREGDDEPDVEKQGRNEAVHSEPEGQTSYQREHEGREHQPPPSPLTRKSPFGLPAPRGHGPTGDFARSFQLLAVVAQLATLDLGSPTTFVPGWARYWRSRDISRTTTIFSRGNSLATVITFRRCSRVGQHAGRPWR